SPGTRTGGTSDRYPTVTAKASSASHASRRSIRDTGTLLLLDDVEQLHVEHEGRPRLDLRGPPLVTVGDVRRTDERRLAADLHHLESLGPALDDAVQGEGRGLVPLDGAVEHRPVGELARVVDLHRVGRLRRVAAPRLRLRVDQARSGLLRALLARRLGEIAFRGLLFRRRGGAGAGLH